MSQESPAHAGPEEKAMGKSVGIEQLVGLFSDISAAN